MGRRWIYQIGRTNWPCAVARHVRQHSSRRDKRRAKTMQPHTCHVRWSGIRWSSKHVRTKEWGGHSDSSGSTIGDPCLLSSTLPPNKLRTFGRAGKVLLWNWYKLWPAWAPSSPCARRSENYASRSTSGYKYKNHLRNCQQNSCHQNARRRDPQTSTIVLDITCGIGDLRNTATFSIVVRISWCLRISTAPNRAFHESSSLGLTKSVLSPLHWMIQSFSLQNCFTFDS